MDLATSLRYWVIQRKNSDSSWKDIKVSISDASVPGEGEQGIDTPSCLSCVRFAK